MTLQEAAIVLSIVLAAMLIFTGGVVAGLLLSLWTKLVVEKAREGNR